MYASPGLNDVVEDDAAEKDIKFNLDFTQYTAFHHFLQWISIKLEIGCC